MERWTFPPIVFPAGCTGSAWSARSAGVAAGAWPGPAAGPPRAGLPGGALLQVTPDGARRLAPEPSSDGAGVRGEAGEASP